ncbi:hypothetical protein JYT60_00680, partial [bacterium AH-315-C08]|nr:hypothetical protein [bacterium AH-315-C08]
AFPLEVKKEPFNLKPFFHGGANLKLDNLKGMTKASLNFLWKFIPERFNKFFFSSSYLSPKSLIRLQVSLGQFPYISNPVFEIPETPVNLEWRNQIKLPKTEGRFDDLLNELIPMQIPKSFLERYSEMKNIALRVYPKKPKVILTGNALYVDEGFKIWTADQVEQGVKLVGIQHGGNYGTSRLSSFEKHEIDISDRYFSWGWSPKNESKVVPLSGNKLIGIEKAISPNPRGNILWTCVFLPRYFHRVYSTPMGPQVSSYIEDQKNFLKSASKEVAKLLVMRTKPIEYGWQIKDRLKEWDPNVQLDWGDGSFYEKINGSRLVVVTGNATVFLETLAANFPTIMFWDPRYWEVRPEAEPFYNILRQAGILYDTPPAAAEKINDIYINPMEWWIQPDVQEARSLFCQQYAYLNEENWFQEWKTALAEISKLDK